MKRKMNITGKRFYGIRKSCVIALFALCVLSSAWSCKEGEENSKVNLSAAKSTMSTLSPKGFKIADNLSELKKVLDINKEAEITKIQYMENEVSHAAFIYFTEGGIEKNRVLATGKIGFETSSIVLSERKKGVQMSNGDKIGTSNFKEPVKTVRVTCGDCDGCRVQGIMDMQSKKMTFGCSASCCSLYVEEL